MTESVSDEVIDRLNAFLPLARSVYEDAKVKHNLDPNRFTFEILEELRRQLEKVEIIAAKWNRIRNGHRDHTKR